jgi:hypothetical protein
LLGEGGGWLNRLTNLYWKPRRSRRAEQISTHSAHHRLGDPSADGTGEGMIGERGDEDAQDDGPRAPEPRRQEQGKQLGFVAGLGEGDNPRRNEQRLRAE